MKEIAELVSQIGISSIIALLLWNFLRDYIEQDRQRYEEDKSYLKDEITKANQLASRERDAFKEERVEFAKERKETMEKFLDQLNQITNITNNNSINISRLTDKMEEISEDITDIKRNLNDKE
ncbi:hypothetical protein [Peptacetobacter sp. AB800]|uniref:hypothetical protein n=1 Tax=Peptacetobacter sp. AB800 TaxID=3388428 RepID=UPI0039FD6D92